MKYFICLFFFANIAFLANAQDYSNKGKDFWIAYPAHNEGTQSVMGIYITSDVDATGTIDVGGTVLPFTLAANAVIRRFVGPGGNVTNNIVYLNQTDGVKTGAGIHVISDRPVAVYAHIIRSQRSGASLILPTNVWGKEYIIPNHRNTGPASGFGEIAVMAKFPNTVIEITPKVGSLTGTRAANVPFQITLPNPGDVYQLQMADRLDLSGTLVRSVSSGTEPCKPITVFSATTYTGMDCTNATGGDNLYQQIFPTASWGKQFLTSPLKRTANIGDVNQDIVKVFVKDASTVVTKTEAGVTTVLTGLIAGSYYQYFTAEPTFIEADKPIQVVQYITSYSCGSPQTQSDPEMVVLSSVEQTTNNITVFAAHVNYVPPGQSVINKHYLNIIIKSNNASTFTINGVAPNATFRVIPGTAYSYIKEDLTSRAGLNPVFTLAADSGFSAIAYGFGDAESYGYNAGTNVKDLYQQIGISSQYGIETTPSTCVNSPFKFKVSLPYQPDSMYWDLAPVHPGSWVLPVTPGTPLPVDSIRIVNGKNIYWYSLPTQYIYYASGTYPIKIKTYFSGLLDGCGNEQQIDFDLEVNNPPVADYNFTYNGCINDNAIFTDLTTSVKPTYRWWWNFDDPGSGANNIANVKNPTHTFSGPGTYNVRYANITTPGCLSDTISKVITVAPLPTANITGNNIVCINSPNPNITFTGALGSIPNYIFTYNINGGATQTINSITNTVSLPVPTTTAGTFVYNLINVQNANCIQAQTGSATVTVNALPTATITGGTDVCLQAASPVITFTGAGGVAPYTFEYNINGAASQFITSVGTTATVAVPTNSAGSFTYNLVRVDDASSNICGQAQTGSATVLVKALPTATISGATSVCQNAASPQITFTGANGTAPYTFLYNINGGAVQTITSAAGVNTATVAVPTNTVGNFTYNLVSVQEGSATTCSQNQTGQSIVQITPLPVANFSIGATSCEGVAVNFNDISTIASGTITAWSWDFGDAGSGANNTSTLQNPQHIFSAAGNYTVQLKVTSANNCESSVFTQPIVIHASPAAAFSFPEICLNDPFTPFTDNSTAATGNITQWLWNFGDANATAPNPNTSSVQNAQHSYTAVGDYAVKLLVTDQNGCRDSLTQTLTINGGNPIADFVLNTNSSLCASETFVIQNKSTIASGIITRLEVYWDNTNAPTVFTTEENPQLDQEFSYKYPEFQTPATKNYDIKVRAYSGITCFTDKIITVTVSAIPSVQFLSLPTACLNQSIIQINQGSQLSSLTGVGYYEGAGIDPTGTFNPSLAGAGIHTLNYIFNSANGCADTASQQITVYANPVVDAGPDRVILQGGSITLTPTVTGNNLQYEWLPNTYLSSNSIVNPVTNTTVDITFTLTVTGEGNCMGSDDVYVKVLLAPKIPNTFSPNNDGINDRWEISYLFTYPGNRVQVFTRTGKKVFESIGYTKPWDGTWQGKSLPVDTYYYIIEPGNGLKPITGYVTIVK